MRKLPFAWLDVFTDRPLSGNALCVVLEAESLTDEEMQAIARETNLSETTFVLPPSRGEATYRNRIFTPQGELPFAGHPTLGTAAALALTGRVTGERLVQETASGLTPVDLEFRDGRLERVVMEVAPPAHVATVDPELVARSLGLSVADLAGADLPPEVIASGVRHLIVPVKSPEVLAAVEPDTAALSRLSRALGVVGAYPFALLGDDLAGYARARLFGPLFGIPEDPATGSAAAPLALYLARHGLLPRGADAFWYEQGVEMGRPSRLWVQVAREGPETRVRVGAQVFLVATGILELP